MKRTHLPLNALRVFDAAARHLSFTRAADELAVTPAAVGQQIRALEDVLGVVLFRRTSKGLELTGEAEAGLDALREGFLHFEESVQAMQAGQSSSNYAIAAPREFYAQWLAPRLAGFRKDNPDIRIQIAASEDAEFTEANLDLAVRLVEGPGELEGVQLEPGHRVVVAAPGAPDGWISWPTFETPDGRENHPHRGQRRTGAKLCAGWPWPRNPAAAAGGRGAGRGTAGSHRGPRTLPPRLLADGPAPAMAAEKGEGAGGVSGGRQGLRTAGSTQAGLGGERLKIRVEAEIDMPI